MLRSFQSISKLHPYPYSAFLEHTPKDPPGQPNCGKPFNISLIWGIGQNWWWKDKNGILLCMSDPKPRGQEQEKRKWGAIPNDPYKALGVSPNNTAAEITSAYKSLADKYHPDKNPGDKEAEEWSRAISEARDVLLKPGKNHSSIHFFKGFKPPIGGTYRKETREEERIRKEAEAKRRAHEAAEAERMKREAERKRKEAEAWRLAEVRRKEEEARKKREEKIREEVEKARKEFERVEKIKTIRARMAKNTPGAPLSEEEIILKKIEEIRARMAGTEPTEKNSEVVFDVGQLNKDNKTTIAATLSRFEELRDAGNSVTQEDIEDFKKDPPGYYRAWIESLEEHMKSVDEAEKAELRIDIGLLKATVAKLEADPGYQAGYNSPLSEEEIRLKKIEEIKARMMGGSSGVFGAPRESKTEEAGLSLEEGILRDKTSSELRAEIARKEKVFNSEKRSGAPAEELRALASLIARFKKVLVVLEKREKTGGK